MSNHLKMENILCKTLELSHILMLWTPKGLSSSACKSILSRFLIWIRINKTSTGGKSRKVVQRVKPRGPIPSGWLGPLPWLPPMFRQITEFRFFFNFWGPCARGNLTWQGARRGLNELNQKVRHHQGGWGILVQLPSQPPMFRQITEFRFFEIYLFLIFWSQKKLFCPLKPSLALGTPFFLGGGFGIFLKFFDPSNSFGDFQGWLCQKKLFYQL